MWVIDKQSCTATNLDKWQVLFILCEDDHYYLDVETPGATLHMAEYTNEVDARQEFLDIIRYISTGEPIYVLKNNTRKEEDHEKLLRSDKETH